MKPDQAKKPERPRRRRWTALRWTIVILVSLVVAPVVLVIALGPTVAGWAAPSVVSTLKTGDIRPGQLTLAKADFSWFNGVRLEGLKLTERDGTVVFELNVRTTKGAVALLRDHTNLGELVASGQAHLVREADGRLNVQRLFGIKPDDETDRTVDSAGESGGRNEFSLTFGSSGPDTNLPFDAALRLENADVSYTDPALLARTGGVFDSVRLDELSATLRAVKDGPGSIELSAKPVFSGGGDERIGALELAATTKDGVATLTLDFDHPDASAKLGLTGDSTGLRLTEPASFRVGEGLTRLVTRTAEGAKFDDAPSITLAVATLSLPAGEGGLADLAHAALDATATLGAVAGSATIDGQTRRFQTEPFTLSLSSNALGQGAHVTGSGSADIEGQDAGTFKADMRVGSLLRDGALAVPVDATGSIALTDVSAQLIDQLYGRTPVNLAEFAGPTLSLTVDATPFKKSEADPAPFGYDLRLTLNGANLSGGGPIRVTPDEIRVPTPITINATRLAAVQPLLGDFLTGYDGGTCILTVKRLVLPLRDREPQLDGLSLDATALASGLRAERDGLGEIKLLDSTLTAKSEPGRPVNVTVDTRVSVAGKRPKLAGSLAFPSIAGGVPTGTLTIDTLPPELARAVHTKNPLAPLVRAALGGDAKATVNIAPTKDGNAPATLEIEAPLLSATVSAGVSQRGVDIGGGAASWTVDPAFVNAALVFAGPDEDLELRPAGPGAVSMTIEKTCFDFKTFELTDPLRAEVRGSLALSVFDLVNTDPKTGKRTAYRSLGPLGVQNLSGNLSLDPDDGFELDLVTDLEQGPGVLNKLTTAAATPPRIVGSVEIKAKPEHASFVLANLDTRYIAEQISPSGPAFHERLPLAVGPKLNLSGDLTKVRPEEQDEHTTHLSLSARADNFETGEPAMFLLGGPGPELAQPAQAEWRITPDYMQAVFTHAGRAEPTAKLTKTAPVTLVVDRFRLGPEGKTFYSKRLALDATLTMPRFALSTPDQPDYTLTNAKVAIDSAVGEGMHLKITSDATGTGEAIQGLVTLANIYDTEGRLTPELPVVTADLAVPAAPTALFDALLGADGWMLELLGPVFSFDLNVKDCTRESGSLAVDLKSDRVGVTVRGGPKDGVLILNNQTRADMTVLTPEMGQRLTKGLPVLPGLTKSADQQPGTITTSGMRIPLDAPLAGLTGEIVIDPGVASVQRSGRLAKVLNLPKAEKLVGERMEPIAITAVGGVLHLPRYSLPIGEFNVAIEGTTDPAHRTMNLTLWAPLFALTDEAAGNLSLGLGGAITSIPGVKSITMVPISASGTYENPKVSANAELFLKTLPGRALDGGVIRNAINGIFGTGSKDNNAAPPPSDAQQPEPDPNNESQPAPADPPKDAPPPGDG